MPFQSPKGLAAAALLALVMGCAAPPPRSAPVSAAAEQAARAADWSTAPRLEVTMDEFAFRPERILLRQGQPVVLRFVNTGARPHDFTAPGFFAAVAFRPGETLGTAIRAARGSVDVPAGQSREVAVLPLAAGTYAVECDKPLHTLFGMTGEIVVGPPG